MLEASYSVYQCYYLTRGKLLLVGPLNEAAMSNGWNIDHVGRDRHPPEDVSAGQQPAMAPDQVIVWRHTDWIEQALGLDTVSEGFEIAVVLAVMLVDLDVCDVNVLNVHDGPPKVRTGSVGDHAQCAVRAQSQSKKLKSAADGG
jgi:hypothetical protein